MVRNLSIVSMSFFPLCVSAAPIWLERLRETRYCYINLYARFIIVKINGKIRKSQKSNRINSGNAQKRRASRFKSLIFRSRSS